VRKPTVTETAIIVNIVLLGILSVFIFRELGQISSLRHHAAAPVQLPQYHFALIYPEEKSPYWDDVKTGVRKASLNSNIHMEYLSPESTDMVEQVDLLNQAVASKVDGIIVQGLNEEAFTPVINKAVEHGIPVLTIDSDAPQSKRAAYIGTDNYYAGVMAGKQIVQMAGGEGDVGIVMGNFFATNQRQRLKGIQDVLAEHPDIRVAAVVDSKANPFSAANHAAEMVKSHPKLKVIVGLSAWDGPGIGQAIKRLGKEGSVQVIAFDQLPETNAHLMDGTVDAILAEDPESMGYKAVEILLDIKEGRPVPTQVNTEVTLQTRERMYQRERR
jgi:ribose transport system substrate-binding protein